jgi:digeranylgeranylglycerophospholipid reductase
VIVVGRETYRAKVVIAADGFPSTVAFLEGLVDERYSSPDNVAVDYQYLMSGVNVEPNVTEMYSGTDLAPGGYAWVIPKSQTTVNVGSGIRTTFPQSRKGIAYLEHFVHNHPSSASKLVDGSIDGVIADVLPVDGAMSKTCSTSVLSVGDAAGMVMATNGGGIPTAIVTGHIAGETAALHVQRGTPLSTYETKWKRALGRQLDASARMRRFADMFMRHDFAFDCALRLLGVRGIRKVLTCKIPMGLGPLMTLLGY